MIGIANLPFLWRSRLELAFQLVQEAPVRAFGDDLVGARLDKASVVQTQRIKAQGVFGVVFAPFVVRKLADALQRIVVACSKSAVDEASRRARRIAGAEIGSLENGTQHALGGDRILAHVLPIAAQQAAEIL